MYKVDFEKRAAKSLLTLPKIICRRIALSLGELSDDPRPLGCKKLTGEFTNYWRIRVGDYRIVYEIDDEKMLIMIYRIMHRKEVYR